MYKAASIRIAASTLQHLLDLDGHIVDIRIERKYRSLRLLVDIEGDDYPNVDPGNELPIIEYETTRLRDSECYR